MLVGIERDKSTSLSGWLRQDDRKGIRNVLAVVYLVECAHFVASEIVQNFRKQEVHLIGFPGCYPNEYADKTMRALCTHPNVGAVLLVSLGCESFNSRGLYNHIESSGRPVHLLTIQSAGGTAATIRQGTNWVRQMLPKLASAKRVPMQWDELVVATICGGSDGTSGISANPAVGKAFDRLIERGATCIFEETGELVGCETFMQRRSATPELGREIAGAVEKAARYYSTLGHGSFAPGNADGGLTTQEEKSLGAYAKSGESKISGMVKPGDTPPTGGLYLLDVVPDGEVRFGFPNIADPAEIVELMSCGAHITLFTTGRGSVVGSAIAPVIKVCANPQTYERLSGDMDVNAGRLLLGKATLDELGEEIVNLVGRVAKGEKSKSEQLGHREFILTYKQFDPIGPACLPMKRS